MNEERELLRIKLAAAKKAMEATPEAKIFRELEDAWEKMSQNYAESDFHSRHDASVSHIGTIAFNKVRHLLED